MKSVLFILLIFFASESALAQSSQVKTKQTRKSKSKNILQKSYYDFSAQYLMWQELIDASGPGLDATARFQFSGYHFGLTHNKPISGIRWVRQYGAHLTLGTAKGSGETAPFLDEFKNQVWYALSASAGITYRTTAVSELSLFVPVSARMISWKLDSAAAFELDKETSFSAGLGLQFTQRFSVRSALTASLAHQFMWEATQWTLGYQYSFR